MAANITAGNTCSSKTIVVPLDDDTAVVIDRVERKEIILKRVPLGELRKKRIKRYAKVFVKNHKKKVPKLNLKGIKQ